MLIIPPLVIRLVSDCGAWVVGSAAEPGKEKPRDWDVMVPLSNWRAASLLIPRDAKINLFGGYKCVSEGQIVDVFLDDVLRALTHPKAQYLWNPQLGIRYQRMGTLEVPADLSAEKGQVS